MSFTYIRNLVKSGFDYAVDSTKMCFMEILLFYGKTCVVANNYITNLFRDFPIVKQSVDFIGHYIQFGKNIFLNIKTEPFRDTWFSLSLLVKNEDYGYDTYEGFSYHNQIFEEITQDFFVANDDTESEKQFIHSVNKSIFLSSYNNLVSFTNIYNNSDVKEIMVLMKYSNKYIVEIKSTNKKEYLGVQFPLVSSRVKFLSILYSHPQMSNPIEIELGNEYSVMHNKILSPLFLKRYLEYRYNDNQYVFDMNYRLKIIDNNIKSYELTSDNYIILYKTTFDVCSFGQETIETEKTE